MLTIPDLRRLATLDDAIQNGRKCRWAKPDEYGVRMLGGVARHYVQSADDWSFAREIDVRDAYVRFSGTFEIVLPVREVLDLMRDEMFVVE